MNGRFQTFMESVARFAGTWQHFLFWVCLLIAWIIWGSFAHFSTTVQLWANTPTTWFELFLGLAILVDGSLITKLQFKHNALMQQMLERQEVILNALKLEEDEILGKLR